MTAIAPSPIFNEPPDTRGLGDLRIVANGIKVSLPLKEVKVRAAIVGPFCRTVVEQHFGNPYDAALEAVHIFPLPVNGAVTEMELRAGEMVVRAECQERQQAEATFTAAREAGHRAALLTAERADVHTLRVTNLPAKTEVIVRFVVVEQLEAMDGRLRWRFPTVVAPRYMPGAAVGHDGPGVTADTDAVPDASRISPPLRLAGGTRLDLEVEIAGPVRALESSLHAIRLDLDGGSVRVAPSAASTLNKDFILHFSTALPDQPAARAWTDGRYTALLVEAPTEAQMPSVPRDAVFVVDISGSMGGIKMTAAKKALSTALHGLMPGDRFKLIAFDTSVELFRPDFSNYDDASMKAADRWIEALHARGGTEMLPALNAAFDGVTAAGRLRTVLFITDGQAGDESRLAAAVANRRNGARLFTLGIDTAVNEALLKQLARVGGGTCELCTPSDDIEAVVVRLEARFGSPLVQGLQVEGGIAARPETEVLFGGRAVAMVVEGIPGAIRGILASGNWTMSLTPQGVTTSLGAIWARQRVSYLEDRLVLRPYEEEAIKPEILRIALEHGIVSRFTAMVAVDRSVRVTGARVEVVQPVEMPEHWEDMGGTTGSFAAMPVPAIPPRMSALFPAAAPPPPAPGGGMRMQQTPVGAPMAADRVAAPPSPMKSAKKSSPATRSRSLLKEAVDAVASVFRGPEAPEADSPADDEDSFAAALPSEAVFLEEAKVHIEKVVLLDEGSLARSQDATGSFGGDLARTCAALLYLVLAGHTRRSGLRSRTVMKAATYLQAHASDPRAALALAVLAAAESGALVKAEASWEALYGAGPEGAALKAAVQG